MAPETIHCDESFTGTTVCDTPEGHGEDRYFMISSDEASEDDCKSTVSKDDFQEELENTRSMASLDLNERIAACYGFGPPHSERNKRSYSACGAELQGSRAKTKVASRLRSSKSKTAHLSHYKSDSDVEELFDIPARPRDAIQYTRNLGRIKQDRSNKRSKPPRVKFQTIVDPVEDKYGTAHLTSPLPWYCFIDLDSSGQVIDIHHINNQDQRLPSYSFVPLDRKLADDHIQQSHSQSSSTMQISTNVFPAQVEHPPLQQPTNTFARPVVPPRPLVKLQKMSRVSRDCSLRYAGQDPMRIEWIETAAAAVDAMEQDNEDKNTTFPPTQAILNSNTATAIRPLLTPSSPGSQTQGSNSHDFGSSSPNRNCSLRSWGKSDAAVLPSTTSTTSPMPDNKYNLRSRGVAKPEDGFQGQPTTTFFKEHKFVQWQPPSPI